jgi:hypothetical protein
MDKKNNLEKLIYENGILIEDKLKLIIDLSIIEKLKT